MADKTPFVINDRRKFTAEGELRHDSEPSTAEHQETPAEEPKRNAAEPIAFPSTSSEAAHTASEPVKPAAEPIAFPASETPLQAAEPQELEDDHLPPAPTAEQSAQATRAYDATVDRLDTAIRATNPGAERMPEMSFDRFVQSLYMQAIIQLGGGAEPGQTPQVDILGARQTIDMLSILADKSKGNLSSQEDKLLQSALFEARMGFLEVTQALARQAGPRPTGAPGGQPGGPSIVR